MSNIEEEEYTPESPNPDAYLYGTYDAMRGLSPEPDEYGYFDEDAEAYNEAYKAEIDNQRSSSTSPT